MFETMTYERNPIPFQCVEVTEENIEEIAQWTKGEIHVVPSPNRTRRKFIKISVKNAQNPDQEKAYLGNVVLYSEISGFKIYTKKAFERSFRKVEGALPRQIHLVPAATAVEVKAALESPTLKNNHSHAMTDECHVDCPVYIARKAAEEAVAEGDDVDILKESVEEEPVVVDEHTAEAHAGLAEVPKELVEMSDVNKPETIRGD